MDSLDVFMDAQVNRIENTLRGETRSEEINRELQYEALVGIDVAETNHRLRPPTLKNGEVHA